MRRPPGTVCVVCGYDFDALLPHEQEILRPFHPGIEGAPLSLTQLAELLD